MKYMSMSAKKSSNYLYEEKKRHATREKSLIRRHCVTREKSTW